MSEESKDVYIRKDIHDKDNELIINEIKHLNSRLDDVKDFITWGMGMLGMLFVFIQIAVSFILYFLSTPPEIKKRGEPFSSPPQESR